MLELGAPTAEAAVREAIATYFSSINGEDWERLATIFHSDAELIAPGTGPRRGGAAVASYYDDALRPYPDHRDEATRVIYAGDVVTVEIHFEGRLANGRPMAFDAVDVFDFAGGRIKRLSSWYDSHSVRRMLLEATTHDPPADGGDVVTPARRRYAIGCARRGAPFRVDGRWLEARAELTARAVLLDVDADAADPAALEAAAADQRVRLRPGDALLLHTGGRGLSPSDGLADWLHEREVAAVATDGPVPGGGFGVLSGGGFDLEALAADSARRGARDGLLVSVPSADGTANAVVFR